MEGFPDSIEDLRKQLDEKSLELEQIKRANAFEQSLEAALESVRSLSLSMKKSEELFGVIQLILDQLLILKINVEFAALGLNPYDSDDVDCWVAVPGALYPFKIFVPYFDHLSYNLFKDAKEKGLNSFAFCLSFEEKNQWLDHVYKHMPGVPEERKKHNYSTPGFTQGSELRRHFSININNYSGVPYTAAELMVLKRFGNAFEQVYSRFLDLQIAESNAVRLQELDTFKSRLYTNITHEFRTPLTVILGMAQQASEKPQESLQEGMTLITRNGQNLLNLVNQILDLSKLESGNLSLHYQQGDVVNFVEYILESLHSLAQSKGVQMHFLSDMEVLTIDFDQTRLQQVVTNLLSNAIKFTPKGGHIYLSLHTQKEALVLKVKDNGAGIPPDKLPLIFDRFYQVDDTATRHGEGTGIGLTLTKELVELMGGKITVQSPAPDGVGTEFSVSLPIHQNAEMGPAKLPAPLMTAPSFSDEMAATQTTESPLSPNPDLPLLLLIEDNTDVAMYIKACLEGRYTIEWAANGAIGIERALETIPDIIISDVMMPEKDGYEVCQTLKNDERTSHVPIVLLTAKADVQSKLEGLGVGADAYLSKPFLKEELFIRLEKLVELRRRLQEKYAGKDFVAFSREAPAPAMSSPDDVFLKRATSFILADLDDAEFGNEELARKMIMSESSLNRKMKALTDKTLSLFIRSVRLQQGKILLQTTDLNISEIAYSVGFTDPAYFSRIFSQEFGAAPSKFNN